MAEVFGRIIWFFAIIFIILILTVGLSNYFINLERSSETLASSSKLNQEYLEFLDARDVELHKIKVANENMGDMMMEFYPYWIDLLFSQVISQGNQGTSVDPMLQEFLDNMEIELCKREVANENMKNMKEIMVFKFNAQGILALPANQIFKEFFDDMEIELCKREVAIENARKTIASTYKLDKQEVSVTKLDEQEVSADQRRFNIVNAKLHEAENNGDLIKMRRLLDHKLLLLVFGDLDKPKEVAQSNK